MERAQQSAQIRLLTRVRWFISLYYFLCVLTHVLQYDRIDPTEFQSLKDEIEYDHQE